MDFFLVSTIRGTVQMNNKFLDLFGEFIETEDAFLLKKVNE